MTSDGPGALVVVATVAHIGLGVALLRRPGADVLRLLFRDAPPGVVPVL